MEADSQGNLREQVFGIDLHIGQEGIWNTGLGLYVASRFQEVFDQRILSGLIYSTKITIQPETDWKQRHAIWRAPRSAEIIKCTYGRMVAFIEVIGLSVFLRTVNSSTRTMVVEGNRCPQINTRLRALF